MSVKVLLTTNQKQGSSIFELKVLPYRGYLIFVDRFVTRIVIFYVQFLTFSMFIRLSIEKCNRFYIFVIVIFGSRFLCNYRMFLVL